jgi:hypothetical protein
MSLGKHDLWSSLRLLPFIKRVSIKFMLIPFVMDTTGAPVFEWDRALPHKITIRKVYRGD